jgi:hypothetical protein
LFFVDVLSQILPNNSYKNIIFAIHNNFVKLNSGRYGCTNDISQNAFGFLNSQLTDIQPDGLDNE